MKLAHHEISDAADGVAPPSTIRQFLILPLDQAPDNALGWRNRSQKAIALRAWRRAVFVGFSDSARALRIAWVLTDLFNDGGFAFAGDGYLAKETGLAVNKVQETLRAMQVGGAIIRVHPEGNLSERRIYPSRSLMPDITPQVGGSRTPRQPGGQNTYNNCRSNSSSISSTALQARRAAELKERRALDRGGIRSEGASAEGRGEADPNWSCGGGDDVRHR